MPERTLTRSLKEELKVEGRGLEACDGGRQLLFDFVALGV